MSLTSLYQAVDISPGKGNQEPLLAVNVEAAKDGAETKFRIRNLTKSTVLRALNRLWEPPSGTVFIDGHDVTDLDVLGHRRKVGMLFQLPALFEGTVADNVRYGPQLKGKKLTDDEVYKLLSLADLDSSFYKKTSNELSVGQAQRVALARTLANEPEEQQGLTVVIVSHSIKQIQRIADVVCLLVNGEIVEVLKPDELSEAKHPMAQRFLELGS
ncbi:hypothetical protein OIU84_000977 [Salix udensis]|uniref:ABC transporter domain-containing protein n=1 Tax=Salix udensis TaxID=889485 RepID=A0AAD6L7I4_9ROSI|nr:hypothetical protein OIU84_000977 [Salix udensis]